MRMLLELEVGAMPHTGTRWQSCCSAAPAPSTIQAQVEEDGAPLLKPASGPGRGGGGAVGGLLSSQGALPLYSAWRLKRKEVV
jgi:hypothetical protein